MRSTTGTVRGCVVLAALAIVCGGPVMGADPGYSGYARHRDLLREATRLENEGRYFKAARTYRKSALHSRDSRTKASLLVRQGDCFFSGGKPYDALTSYRQLLQDYPLFVPYDHVIGRLRELAERFVRGDGTFLGIRDKDKAIEVYELIQQEVPSLRAESKDALRLARLLTERDRQAEAADVYRTLLKKGVSGSDAADAHLELGRLLVQSSRHGDGDGRTSRDAERHLQTFLEQYPADERRSDAEFMLGLLRERRAERLYTIGEFYSRDPHLRVSAARRYLGEAATQYGDTTSGQMAGLLLARLDEVVDEPVDEPAEPTPGTAEPEGAVVTPTPPVVATPAPVSAPAVSPAVTDRPANHQPTPRKQFRPIAEREQVQKHLLPIGDINDLDTGEAAK